MHRLLLIYVAMHNFNKTEEKVISIARKLYHLPGSSKKHFSFLVCKNRIVSVGWNDSFKTHPLGEVLGYRFGTFHSELSCFLNCQYDFFQNRKLKFYNVRLNRRRQILNSKPCSKCQVLLAMTSISEIYYTGENGFRQMEVNIDVTKVEKIRSEIIKTRNSALKLYV